MQEGKCKVEELSEEDEDIFNSLGISNVMYELQRGAVPLHFPPSLYSFVLGRGGGTVLRQGTTTLFIEKSFWVLFIQSWFNLEIQIYRDCVDL